MLTYSNGLVFHFSEGNVILRMLMLTSNELSTLDNVRMRVINGDLKS